MKKIALFSFSVAALLIAGCNEKPTPGPGTDDGSENNGGDEQEKPADVVFAATLTEAGETNAIIALSHDGTNDDTYYGFYTSDLTASVEDAVNKKVEELKSTVSDLASVLYKGKTRNAVLGGLEAETDYRYIVFGLKEDGTVYGTAGSCDFKTAESTALKYTVNPAWTVAYAGKEVYQGMLVETISVTSTSSERFATAVWNASAVEEYGIQAVIEQSLSELTSEEGWIDYTYTESVDELYNVFTDGVEQIAIVYGLTEDGQPTGKYAQSEKFLPEVIETSDEYAKWLGNWVFTDSNEFSLPVSISYGAEPGKSYAVKGLQGFSDIVDGVLNDDGSFSVRTTDKGNYTHNQYGPYNLWYLGQYFNESKGQNYFITGDYDIFTAVYDEDLIVATGGQIEIQSGGSVEIVAMEFAGIILSGDYEGSVLSYNNQNVELPCLMTKVAAASSAKKASVSKNNKFTSISATTNQLMKSVSVAK